MEQSRNRPGRFDRLARLPLTCLLLQIAVSVTVLHVSGRLEPQIVPDTGSYLRASRAPTIEMALRQHRTNGYPLLLKAMETLRLTETLGRSMRTIEPSHLAAIPLVHATLFFTAVTLFWFALRAWAGSGWLALAAATPLTSAPVLGLIPRIQPDFAASALALMAVSILLFLTLRPGRRLLWVLLTVVVFLTYQVRPAYVFLIPFVPVMGWLLRWCREGLQGLAHARWTAGLALAMILPFLLFAGARRVLVGDFGLVSFAGCNLIGITASMIDDDMIAALPPETQELATRILALRRAKGWEPMTLDGDTRVWQEQYLINTWRLAINPARRMESRHAEEAERRGESRRFRDIEVNDTLLTISRTAIRQRPHLYLKWVRGTFLSGVGRIVRFHWVLWPLVALLATLPIAWIRRRARSALAPRLLGLVLLCGAYTVSHLLLVVAVSNAFDRYLVAVALLLPTALCSLLFSLWQREATSDRAAFTQGRD